MAETAAAFPKAEKVYTWVLPSLPSSLAVGRRNGSGVHIFNDACTSFESKYGGPPIL